jgi:sugar lactone lactonase YvrE
MKRHIVFGTTALALAIVTASTSGIAAQFAPKDLPAENHIGQLEQVFAFYDAMPTGITVTKQGRLFVNFPRWGDKVPFTIGEIRDGKAIPYPNQAINTPNDKDPAHHFISVQSVVADGQGRIWVLDTAAPEFSAPQPGGAKLVAIDLNTNKIVKTLVFPNNVVLPSTYVNDMRFDFRTGQEGTVYVTDSSVSGPGAIIVMDIATGKAVRRLSGDASTSVDRHFRPTVEGKAMQMRDAQGHIKPFGVASDGIALSPDGQTLYFSPLSSRHLYSVPTRLLRDPQVDDPHLSSAVLDMGEKGASDGLEADAAGTIYASDYEHNDIRKRLPDGTWQTLVHDPRVLWPDTLSIGPDGYLYFTANQLHRQAGFNGGKDMRIKPYSLFRIKIDAAPAPTR